MPLTPNGLPYPADTDPPNVPTDIQNLAEALDRYAHTAVGGVYVRNINQTIPTGTSTWTMVQGGLSFVEGALTLNVATGEITIGVAGLYQLYGWATWVASAAGTMRHASWWVNTTRVARASVAPSAAGVMTAHCSTLARLGVTAKVSLQVMHDAGAALALDGTQNATGYTITRIAP